MNTKITDSLRLTISINRQLMLHFEFNNHTEMALMSWSGEHRIQPFRQLPLALATRLDSASCSIARQGKGSIHSLICDLD